VADGQTLIHIADLGKLWLEVRIPESELGKITQPSGAFFHLEGEDNARVLEAGRNARLVAYGGLVNKDTRTVPAIFEIDNPEGRLRAGMNLRVGLYTGRSEKILAIPASAIVDENGITVVFVQKEGESFERRVVEPGTRDGEWVGLRSGISNGERIVSIGAYQVRLAATAPAALGHGHAH
jgi:multidrug efflux pump subunit AcrA (membrane-fusion protein)